MLTSSATVALESETIVDIDVHLSVPEKELAKYVDTLR
jgi:hypothetical protein